MIGMPIDVLQCCKVLPQLPLDHRQTLQYLLEGVSLEHHYFFDVVDFLAVDVELSDDADCSLPSDEEMLQVEAGVVFVDLGPKIQDFAVREDCFQTQDVRAEGTVLDDILSACVGRSVSSDLTRAFRPQIKRRLESVRLNVLV